jgi:hypothetical protein
VIANLGRRAVMAGRASVLLGTALVCFTVGLHHRAAWADSDSANTTQLTVSGMAAAVDALVARYGYVITLEEPKLPFSGDFEDMKSTDRNDLDRYPSGKAPKTLVPRQTSFSLDVPVSFTVSSGDVAAVLQQLIQLQAQSGHGAHYRVDQVGNVFNVIPTEARDHNGNWSVTNSIFDTPISLQQKSRSVLDTVNEICSAVGSTEHIPVKVLMAPTMMLANSTSTVGANAEPARSVLTRALTGLNAPLTWRATYFRQMHSYLLVILVAPDKSRTVKAQTPSAQTPVPKSTPSGAHMGDVPQK